MIDAEPDLMVCGEADSDREARAVLRRVDPDVMIVDVSLAQGDGMDLVREVHAQRPQLPMLVLSMPRVMTFRPARYSMQAGPGPGQAGAVPWTGSAANRRPAGIGR